MENVTEGKFSALDRAETVDEFFAAIDAEGFMRERPYTGQNHTCSGERGRQVVTDVSMRDVRDCLFLALFEAAGVTTPDFRLTIGDAYKLNLNEVDILAVAQNMCNHIEKRMGIYPNVPGLKESSE